MLDDASPPESPGAAAEAMAPLTVTVVEDEVSHLRAQLEAIREAKAQSEREAADAAASHAEAQAQLLDEFLVKFPVHSSGGILL